jgi:hypothetical protein
MNIPGKKLSEFITWQPRLAAGTYAPAAFQLEISAA